MGNKKGKAFEHVFRLSLKALQGFDDRIEDGGGVGKNKQTADFYFGFNDRPGWYAIECKHAEGKSFELRKIGYGDHGGQMARLLRFDNPRAARHAYVAIEMRGGCYLMPIHDFDRIAAACIGNGRVSVPEASMAPYKVEKAGGIYRLEFK